MQMINNALEPEELEKFKKMVSPAEAANRHERRAEDARKRAMDKMVDQLVEAGKSRGL